MDSDMIDQNTSGTQGTDLIEEDIAAGINLMEQGQKIVELINSISSQNQPVEDGSFSWEDWKHEFERFAVWADNLGLHHTGHSSLDYRLRDTDTLKKFVSDLLFDLEQSLHDVITIIFPQEHSDKAFESVGRIDLDDSDAFSDEFLDEYRDDEEVPNILGSVIDIIDRLYRAATNIRNPVTRLLPKKALSLCSVDEETGVDLFGQFEKLDRLHLEDIFRDFRRRPATGSPVAVEFNEDDMTLIARLAKANSQRRRLFSYWQRHQMKKSAETTRALNKIIIPALAPSVLTKHLSDGLSKPSTATNLPKPVQLLFDDVSTVASTVVSAQSVAPEPRPSADDQVLIPDPPAEFHDSKYFTCLYCNMLCSKKFLRRSAWREHVLRDLRPYVCTYAQCKTGDQMYDNWRDWVTHEQWTHNRVWRCLEHPELLFSNREAANRHVIEDHSEHVVKDNATSKNLLEESLSGSSNRCCPFCGHSAELVESLQVHIATHLQRIALFVLPRRGGNQEGSATSDVGSGVAHIAKSDSKSDASEVELSEFTGTYYCDGAITLSPHFVRRREYEELIEEQLWNPAAENESEYKLLIVSGSAGVGKSHIVLDYLNANREKYIASFWINAQSSKTIEADFKQIFFLLYRNDPPSDIRTAVEQVKIKLQDDSRYRLLVFDGFDSLVSPSQRSFLDLRPYLPLLPGVHIIITTRRPEASPYSSLQPIRVDALALENTTGDISLSEAGSSQMQLDPIQMIPVLIKTSVLICDLCRKYKDAPRELDNIAEKFQSIVVVLERIGSENPNPPGNLAERAGPHAYNSLRECLSSLHSDAKKLLEKVSKYDRVNSEGPGRRVLFALKESSNLTDLRRRATYHENTLQLWYMTLVYGSLKPETLRKREKAYARYQQEADNRSQEADNRSQEADNRSQEADNGSQ